MRRTLIALGCAGVAVFGGHLVVAGAATTAGAAAGQDALAPATAAGPVSVALPQPSATAQPGQWQRAAMNGMTYYELLPDGFDPAKRYPVLMILHGSGGDPGVPGIWNGVNTSELRARYHVITVTPVCQGSSDSRNHNWGGLGPNPSQCEEQALAIVKDVVAKNGDPGRVYVAGHSLGGIGTYDMLVRYNAYNGRQDKVFAAGVPIAGLIRPDAGVVSELTSVPIYAVHGAQDTVVSPDPDRALAAQLKGDGHFAYVEDPARGHDIADYLWGAKGVTTFDWLYQWRSGVSAPAPGGTASPAPTTSTQPTSPGPSSTDPSSTGPGSTGPGNTGPGRTGPGSTGPTTQPGDPSNPTATPSPSPSTGAPTTTDTPHPRWPWPHPHRTHHQRAHHWPTAPVTPAPSATP